MQESEIQKYVIDFLYAVEQFDELAPHKCTDLLLAANQLQRVLFPDKRQTSEELCAKQKIMDMELAKQTSTVQTVRAKFPKMALQIPTTINYLQTIFNNADLELNEDLLTAFDLMWWVILRYAYVPASQRISDFAQLAPESPFNTAIETYANYIIIKRTIYDLAIKCYQPKMYKTKVILCDTYKEVDKASTKVQIVESLEKCDTRLQELENSHYQSLNFIRRVVYNLLNWFRPSCFKKIKSKVTKVAHSSVFNSDKKRRNSKAESLQNQCKRFRISK